MPKYKTNYQAKWEKQFPDLQKCDDPYSLKCVICKSTISFANGGAADLTKHINGATHKSMVRQAASRKMTNYFTCKFYNKFKRKKSVSLNVESYIFFSIND